MNGRHQISGNGFLWKTVATLFVAVGVFLCFLALTSPWRSILDLIVLVFLFAGLVVTWLVFRKVHPVYFDDEAFYFKIGGIEQKVNYSSVIDLRANWVKGRGGANALTTITLNYTYIDSTARAISFYPISTFKYNPLWMLIQCEKVIQVTRPDFKISGYTPELKAEKELGNERKYTLRY